MREAQWCLIYDEGNTAKPMGPALRIKNTYLGLKTPLSQEMGSPWDPKLLGRLSYQTT